MLYLWPYIILFSWPLTFPVVLEPLVRRFPDGPLKAYIRQNLIGSRKTNVPGLLSSVLFLLIGITTVHYNTIIHPFTLADNRHYVFYVFRILRRHPAIKYLAVPVYYICSWIALQVLASQSEGKAKVEQSRDNLDPTIDEASHQPCQLSFVFVWLAVSALSLISAPLVEPRYFIIPWIMWRLHVPSISASPSSKRNPRTYPLDMRLVIETAWLLAFNGLTVYNFLYRGFTWVSEPGKVQRFLY